MHVQALWRYPVKSMRGERLTEAALQKSGMEGDRNIVVVSKSRNNIITARTHPGLLGLQASITAKGVTTIEGHPWQSPEALALTCEAENPCSLLMPASTPSVLTYCLYWLLPTERSNPT